MEHLTGDFLCLECTWLHDRFVEWLSNRQHHYCHHDPANSPDRYHEGRWRRECTDLRHVCCVDTGLRTGGAIACNTAVYWSSPDYRWRDGNLSEFQSLAV